MAKHLQFLKDYWDLLISGRKTLTIRYGKVTDYKVGDEVFIHCGGYVLGKARITKIEYKKVRDLTEEEAYLDGFKSKKELINTLKKYYKHLKDDDIVTIIWFEWIERFKEPIFSEKFAWKGVEISPVELAKLALEHLNLSEKQKKYLQILIQEGSIRKAAIKLGGLHKRGIFRKILRKCLEELIEKGILKASSQ